MDLVPDSPPLTKQEFTLLARDESIWSPGLGLGTVVSQYPDLQIIAQFGSRRMRLRYDEHVLYRPQSTEQPRQRIKVETPDGTVSMTKFKKQQRDRIANEFILISEVAKTLGVSNSMVLKRIEQTGIKIGTYGARYYIRIHDLQKILRVTEE